MSSFLIREVTKKENAGGNGEYNKKLYGFIFHLNIFAWISIEPVVMSPASVSQGIVF